MWQEPFPYKEGIWWFAWVASHPYQAQSCLKAFSAITAMQIYGIEMSSSTKKLWMGNCFHLILSKPLLQPSNGSNQFWVWTNAFIRYLPPPHSASCPSASTVFVPVTECKTTTSVSFNRWYHHLCKWSIRISGWMKIHHYCNHQHIVSCNGWIIDTEEVLHIIHWRGSLVWFLLPIVRTLSSVLEIVFPGT